MMAGPESLSILFSVIQGLAILLTLFRLYFRLRIQRFWWEDVWAATMVVCGIALIIGQLLSYETDDGKIALITGGVSAFALSCTVWASRMSLLYSIIRIISPSSVLRKFTYVLAALFLLFWATIIALKTYWCVNNTISKHSSGKSPPICALSNVVISFEATTGCVSDVILVILSLKLLWRVKLARRLRRMILCLFSSSAITSVFSLAHAICYFVPLKVGQYLAFAIEPTAALIICNLLVVVTYVYRVIRSSPNGSLPADSSEDDDDFTTPAVRANVTPQLTTVDLDVTLHAHTGNGTMHSNLTGIAPPSLHGS